MKKIYSILFFVAVGFSAHAQTANLTPSKDNSIYSESTNSSGLGQLYAGQTCSSDNRRALMQFDVSSIPSNAVVSSVSLTVNVTNVSAGASSNTYRIHALTTDFGEGASNGGGTGATALAPDATWSDAMLGTSAWSTPGGDFVSAALSAVSMGTTTGNQVFVNEPIFVSAVQSWINTPASNFGIIMIGEEGTTCTARRFGSKDIGVAPVLSVTYTLPCAGPTAVCQDISVFLDAGGNASIVAADIDGGSTDDCNTGSITFAASQTNFTCADAGSGGGGDLLISGVYDGPLPGGLPKGVELYAGAAIADLSTYGIGSANNGGGTDGEEYTFPSVSLAAGQYIYITTDSLGFVDFFGNAPDFVDGSMAINGDDAVELFQNGVVIDVFGDINTDGTGQPWEYTDGWVYRNDLVGANAGVFNVTNWTYSGIDALDGETSNATAANPFPIATYTGGGSGVPVTLTVTDGLGNTDVCTALVSVLDTITPTPDVPTLPDLVVDCPVQAIVPPQAQDNCAGSIPGTTTTTFPITASTIVTWTYNDGNGNSTSQDLVVTINPIDVSTVLSLQTLSANASGPGITYQWIDCSDNSAIPGETNQLFEVLSPGDFAVIVSNGSCSDTSQCVFVEVQGLDELIDLGITIAPNPSTGLFNVSFDNVVSGIVTIVDANGRLIQTKEVNANATAIDLTSNESGLYFINVTTDEGISRARIVKQ